MTAPTPSSQSTRPAIWAAIRTLHQRGELITAPLVRAHLAGQAPGAMSRVRDYLHALAAGGYLARDAGAPGVYTLAIDNGAEAPRIRADGTSPITTSGQERMWSVMRVLCDWSAIDLAVHCTVDDHVVAQSAANDYCQRLCRAGYLRRVGRGRWALVPSRWSGPLPPQVRRDKSVYDPNNGRCYRPGRAS